VRLRGLRVPFDPEDRFVAASRFERAGVAIEADLVHVQTPFAAHRAGVRLARLRGLPVVETWHTDFEQYFEHYLPLVPGSVARSVARRWARWVASEVDHLVVPSKVIAERFSGRRIRTPFTVVPTGVSAAELGPGDGARFRCEHGIAPGRRVAVHIGRVAHEKNLDFLLRVTAELAPRLPGFLLLIAGEGPALLELGRRTVELGIEPNVMFVGYLDRKRELADAYRAGDCFVFSSLTETQGLVLLEAMSLGVPVVSLEAQGTIDLLAARRGALVPRPEVGNFAAAVERLLLDPELARRLGREGRELALDWSPERCAGAMARTYEEVVARKRSRAAVEALPKLRR
jgi:glycosyltransferase involved in cell wall biosynthesis